MVAPASSAGAASSASSTGMPATWASTSARVDVLVVPAAPAVGRRLRPVLGGVGRKGITRAGVRLLPREKRLARGAPLLRRDDVGFGGAHRGLRVVSRAAPVVALHLVSGAGRSFSTRNRSPNSETGARARRTTRTPRAFAVLA